MPTSPPSSPSSLRATVPSSMRRCRERLDALDHRLVTLLCQRSSLSVRVAQLKRVAGLPLHAPKREGEILRRVQTAARAPLTAAALTKIYRVILAEMRSAQRRATAGRR